MIITILELLYIIVGVFIGAGIFIIASEDVYFYNKPFIWKLGWSIFVGIFWLPFLFFRLFFAGFKAY